MITGSDSDVVAEAWCLLDAAQRDPDTAKVLDRLVGELRNRVRTLAEDKPNRAGLVGDQLRLLARMSHRYATGPRCHPAAAWKLATIYRLTDSAGSLHAA